MINEDPIIIDDPPQPNQAKVQALMLKFLKRRQNIQPNNSDGFMTTNSLADSESGSSGTSGIGT